MGKAKSLGRGKDEEEGILWSANGFSNKGFFLGSKIFQELYCKYVLK
jgi:hypothetical protein